MTSRQGALVCQLVFERLHLPYQLSPLHRPLDSVEQLVIIEGFGEKIIRPQLHGLDGGGDVAVCGDDDHRHLRDQLFELC